MDTIQNILIVLVCIIIIIRTIYLIRRNLLIRNYEKLHDLLLLQYNYEGGLFLCNICKTLPKYFQKHLRKQLSDIDEKYPGLRTSNLSTKSKSLVGAFWIHDDFESRSKFINLIIKELEI